MRVIYIHHNPSKGGSSKSLFLLLKYLSENKPDLDLFVITPKGNAMQLFKTIGNLNVLEGGRIPELASVAGEKFPMLRTMYTFFNFYHNIDIIYNKVKAINPDIIHLNEICLGLIARKIKKAGYKVISHARIVPSHKAFAINYVTHFLTKRYIDVVIAIDEASYNYLPDSTNKIIAYNPVANVPTIDLNYNSREQFNILFLANLLSQKGIFEFIKVAMLLRDYNNIQFHIAGQNPRPDSYYKKTVSRFLDKMNIMPNNKQKIKKLKKRHKLDNLNLLGYVDNIDKLLRDTDLILLPSFMNQPSRCVYEAAFYRIPSIMTMKNEVNDIIINGKTGFIFKEKDVVTISKKIVELYKNHTLHEKLAFTARKNALKNHDLKANGEKIYIIYNQILKHFY